MAEWGRIRPVEVTRARARRQDRIQEWQLKTLRQPLNKDQSAPEAVRLGAPAHRPRSARVEQADVVDLPPLPLLHGEVEDREGKISITSSAIQGKPAQHRGGHRPDDLGADAAGPEHWGNRDDRRAFREAASAGGDGSHRRESLLQLGDRPDAFETAPFFDRFPQLDEHDDAGLGRHAEAGDVADPNRDAEIEAEEPLEHGPSREGSPARSSSSDRHQSNSCRSGTGSGTMTAITAGKTTCKVHVQAF